MWPFLFILAIVPMIFFWSDAVRELWPQLSDFLPEKNGPVAQPQAGTLAAPDGSPVPGKWYGSQTAQGYVAWMLSNDGQYRLTVGCHTKQPATLQVSALSAQPLAQELHLNYQYGVLALEQGYYKGGELINGVAQFKEVTLQDVSAYALARFTARGTESNAVARSLAEQCAPQP